MKRAAWVSAIALLLGLSLWASDIRMTGSPVVPSAVGVVSIDHDHNGNTIVRLRVHHLAQPTSLASPKNTWVVWVQPPDREAEPVGEIKPDKQLNGSLETRTAYRNFDVFITAEDSLQPERPTGPVVLRASVQQ